MTSVCSYGGGLDSWTMLLKADALGERPDVVAFVDVGDPDNRADHPGEWDGTYRHIEDVVKPWCAAREIEFVEISARTGYLVRDARSLFQWMWDRGQIPVSGPNRICTIVAKVERFEAWLDARYAGREVEVWVGFDAAERDRAENDPNKGKERGPAHLGKLPPWWRWTRSLAFAMTHAKRVNRFPLIEWDLCRCRCEELARESGYPVPRKSACMGCCYGTKADWQTLQRERPAVFDQYAELERRKPPTAKNGRKLSIKNYDSRTQTGTPLRVYVSRPSPRQKPIACPVCGAARRATKAAGCGYLDDNAGERAA